MSNRITKNSVKRAFYIFTKEAGIPTSAKWLKTKREYSKRFLKLDYNSHYGGWRMDWVNKNTSESFFQSTSARRSTKEMYNYLWGLIHARRMKRGGGMKKYPRKRRK